MFLTNSFCFTGFTSLFSSLRCTRNSQDPLLTSFYVCLFACVFEMLSHFAILPELKLTMETRLASNSLRSSCLCPMGTRCKGVCSHNRPMLTS